MHYNAIKAPETLQRLDFYSFSLHIYSVSLIIYRALLPW